MSNNISGNLNDWAATIRGFTDSWDDSWDDLTLWDGWLIDPMEEIPNYSDPYSRHYGGAPNWGGLNGIFKPQDFMV